MPVLSSKLSSQKQASSSYHRQTSINYTPIPESREISARLVVIWLPLTSNMVIGARDVGIARNRANKFHFVGCVHTVPMSPVAN